MAKKEKQKRNQKLKNQENEQFKLAESEKVAAMTRTFEKFVPKQFLKRITGQGGLENIEVGKAESEVITILFSDLRSFTTLSENMTPQELLNFLNAYLKRMNKPIHEHHGFIDKFIGDAIMALFDTSELPDGTTEQSQQALNGVEAAIAMQEAIKVYNVHRNNVGYQPIYQGIGVHIGPVIIGTVGSEDRMDSTVLGDSVNTAARLEGLTKTYGASIVISAATFNALTDPEQFFYRELDWVKVKGKTKPVAFYEIFDADLKDIQKLKKESGQQITQGIQHRKKQRWKEAMRNFQKALDIYPEDQVAQLHLQRCHQLQETELPKDWDGAIILDKK